MYFSMLTLSKNPILGISLAVVMASAAISLVLMEQKALAVTTVVDPCPPLIVKLNATKAKLTNDIQTNNFSTFSTDLRAYIAAYYAAVAAGCSVT